MISKYFSFFILSDDFHCGGCAFPTAQKKIVDGMHSLLPLWVQRGNVSCRRHVQLRSFPCNPVASSFSFRLEQNQPSWPPGWTKTSEHCLGDGPGWERCGGAGEAWPELNLHCGRSQCRTAPWRSQKSAANGETLRWPPSSSFVEEVK